MARRPVPPFETEIHALADRGVGVGTTPDGREVRVRGTVPGMRVAAEVFKRSGRTLHARRTATIRPAPDAVPPRCAVFGLCGGCTLQELPLAAQRGHKHALAVDAVGGAPTVHAPRGGPHAYGYRNKVELSFGVRRYLSEEDHARGLPVEGRWLGFHAPGRFDRVVDTTRCELVSERMNAVIAAVRAHVLQPHQPPPLDVKCHEGFWRHLALREGMATGELLAVVHTTSQGPPEAVAALAEVLLATPVPGGRLVGVSWRLHDGVSDIAGGEVEATWGRATLREELAGRHFELAPQAFFQTSTEGAEVLYGTVGEALGRGGTLVDLYCGVGAIGLVLADGFDRVIGWEVVPEAVENARANAAANDVDASFEAVKVEEAIGTLGAIPGPRRIVVDPPRAGLHPIAAKALATAEAEVLVYVACHPASLGRDRPLLEAGGWRLTDLWTVDLFPQTGHVEAVARFVREPAP
ncbi:MAG: 23S rRNA (uracil(1939)-C(5))-methyltransferase RlmD [Alphaproteobacteria bacterium]|nr:23S rRNA (uracil(1939)-C(5))-methyltransferase RlmD [Alphaproteobacteria bacterium]